MDWGTLIVQVTAIVGALAALVAVVHDLYEIREKRQKHREPGLPDAAEEQPGPPAGSPSPSQPIEAPPASPPRRATNLPSQSTSLVGREQELAEIEELLLRPDVRLLTLTGPAGIGKTRLALQAAAGLLDQYANGVFLVNLSTVADPSLVIPTIAQVLDLREQGDTPLPQILKDHLHEKQMLLVLDNFEQVMGAAETVGELITAAPQLTVLVTSREILRLYGEHVFVVPPLALPDLALVPAGIEPASALAQYEALRLFVDRARAANSSFALTDENVAEVAEICRRLDGLPLAIELAAARIRLLSPQAMLQRLDEATGGPSLELLTGGPRDLPARQQTLRNTLAWSYDLLDADERALFRCLGVFSGGWTVGAAEAVCRVLRPGAPAPAKAENAVAIDVLHGLESLIDKSLVRQPEPDGGRITMLQTIREYALERLDEAGDGPTVREAHAAYYLEFAEQAEVRLYGAAQKEWLQRIEADYDNLRAALKWTVVGGKGEVALPLAASLAWFWNLRGRVSEGRAWLEAALAIPAPRLTEARARALNGLAELVSNQGEWATAWTAIEEAVSIARELGDHRLLARALASLSLFRVRGAGGGGPETQSLADESLAIARSLGDPWTLGYVLTVLDIRSVLLGDHRLGSDLGEEALRCFETAGDQWGIVLSLRHLCMGAVARGDYVAAQAAGEKALGASRALGDRLGEAYTLNSLADIARLRGDYARAEAYYEASLALYRELGLKGDIPASLHNRGYMALARGATAEAKALQVQSLELHRQAGNRAGMLEALTGLAAVARVAGDLSRAARLFGAVEALRTALDAPDWPAERVEYDRHVAALRDELDEAVLSDAWDTGRAMTLDQAVADALDAAPARQA